MEMCLRITKFIAVWLSHTGLYSTRSGLPLRSLLGTGNSSRMYVFQFEVISRLRGSRQPDSAPP